MSVPEKKLFHYPRFIKAVGIELSALHAQIKKKQELILENETRICTEREKALPEVRANLKENEDAHAKLELRRPFWVSKHGEEFVANEISACEREIRIAKAAIETIHSTIATSEANIKLAQAQLKELEKQKSRFIENKVQLYGFFIDSKRSKYILTVSAEKKTQPYPPNLAQPLPQMRH